MVVFGFPLKKRIISFITAFLDTPAKHKEYDLILVRGAPGVGKTTLGKRLRAHFPQGITIEVDSFKSMVNLLDWNDTTQYHHILEAVAMTCRSYLDNGYAPVIIIDTLSAETLGDFMAILQKSPLEATCLIITLVCDPDVLELRIKGRENGFSLIEPSLAINDDMRKYRVFDEFLVDTTTSSPDDVLALVLARI